MNIIHLKKVLGLAVIFWRWKGINL